MLIGMLAGLGAAVLFGVGAVVQAHAVRSIDEPTHRLGTFVRVGVRSPLILLVVATYLAGFVLHAVAIWLLPLYLAQAAIAFSLPVTALSAVWVHERVTARQWLAVLLVVFGLLLLALGAGAPGAVHVSGLFVAALLAGLTLILVAAGLLRSGIAFGALSGLAYAGSAIAVRGVTWPVSPLVAAALLTVPAFGLLGFWLYSTGLDRGDVSSVTAPMIVGQTVVPGVVGVLLLDDGIRPGWWGAVVVGLVLAMAGSIMVGRAGPDRAPVTPSAPPPLPGSVP